MFEDVIFKIYLLSVNKGSPRISWLEQHFKSIKNTNISSDDEKNEPDLYAKIFNDENYKNFETLYQKLLSEIRKSSYEGCDIKFEALMFLQQIVATALWKYRCNVGQELEFFVRDFDRLDIPSERLRFYAKEQQRGN